MLELDGLAITAERGSEVAVDCGPAFRQKQAHRGQQSRRAARDKREEEPEVNAKQEAVASADDSPLETTTGL
jgi:hypothetical protein